MLAASISYLIMPFSSAAVLPIGQVFDQVMQATPHAHRWKAGIVVDAWRGIVPAFIAQWIDKTYFKAGKLFVHTTSGSVRQELRAAKAGLVQRLRTACCENIVVNDIVFL